MVPLLCPGMPSLLLLPKPGRTAAPGATATVNMARTWPGATGALLRWWMHGIVRCVACPWRTCAAACPACSPATAVPGAVLTKVPTVSALLCRPFLQPNIHRSEYEPKMFVACAIMIATALNNIDIHWVCCLWLWLHHRLRIMTGAMQHTSRAAAISVR